MAPKLLVEGTSLLTHGQMPVVIAPLSDAVQGAVKARFHRLSFHHPSVLPGPTPVKRDAQQVETALLLTLASFWIRGRRRRVESC